MAELIFFIFCYLFLDLINLFMAENNPQSADAQAASKNAFQPAVDPKIYAQWVRMMAQQKRAEQLKRKERAGQTLETSGRAAEVAGKGMQAGGNVLMKAGTGLSGTGVGAIAGAPLTALGGAAKAAGKGMEKGGQVAKQAGQQIKQSAQEKRRQLEKGKKAKRAGQLAKAAELIAKGDTIQEKIKRAQRLLRVINFGCALSVFAVGVTLLVMTVQLFVANVCHFPFLPKLKWWEIIFLIVIWAVIAAIICMIFLLLFDLSGVVEVAAGGGIIGKVVGWAVEAWFNIKEVYSKGVVGWVVEALSNIVVGL